MGKYQLDEIRITRYWGSLDVYATAVAKKLAITCISLVLFLAICHDFNTCSCGAAAFLKEMNVQADIGLWLL